MDFAINDDQTSYQDVSGGDLQANHSFDIDTELVNVSTLLSESFLHNKDYLLWILNEKLYFSRFLPATMFIGTMALLGSIGNGAVVCVYKSLRKRNTANAFIFCLGIVDLLICMFVMPYKLFDMRFPLMFGNSILCKCYQLFEISLSMVSITLMICIAIDRYIIVSRPMNKLSLEKVYRIVLGCIVFGLLSSWPTLLIYGKSKVKTDIPEIVGSTCGVAEEMKTSNATKVWYYFLYFVFVVTLIILAVIYSKIWILIRRWKSTVIGENVSNMPRWKLQNAGSQTSLIAYGTNKNVSLCKYIPMKSFSTDPQTASEEEDMVPLQENSSDSSIVCCSTLTTPRKDSLFMKDMRIFRLFPRNRKRRSRKISIISATGQGRHVRMRRNTLVFGAISVVFVLSYLPCLVVIFMKTLRIYKVTHAPCVSAQVAEIFIRSGYINSMLNPCIYSFMCPNFRKGLKDLLFKSSSLGSRLGSKDANRKALPYAGTSQE